MGDYALDSVYVFEGTHSLMLGGAGATIQSMAVDTSACAAVGWSWRGKRGPETPDASDNVSVNWFDGIGWVSGGQWVGIGLTEDVFSLNSTVTLDPAAAHTQFSIQLISVGSGANFDNFFLDNFSVGCAP
jgi:hypothetical protein